MKKTAFIGKSGVIACLFVLSSSFSFAAPEPSVATEPPAAATKPAANPPAAQEPAPAPAPAPAQPSCKELRKTYCDLFAAEDRTCSRNTYSKACKQAYDAMEKAWETVEQGNCIPKDGLRCR